MRPSAVRYPAILHLVILIVYLLLAVWYTHPLLALRRSHIAGVPSTDPLLNASVLWWNATTIPLTDAWWNPPYFFPSHGVTTFTENLLGVSVIATPIYWLTGNPLTTYNVGLFLTWPLSAFAAYLLAWSVTRRRDAAVIAGLAYGFSPYRAAQVGHIQMASGYWILFALLGLHRYLTERRVRWLVLFGAGWLLQSLANGYLMLYGAVLIALWILYFGSKRIDGRAAWRDTVPIVVTWAIASVPLIPIMLTYRSVHAYYALERSLAEPIGMAYSLKAWFAVSDIVWLWSRVFPDDGDNLFPGITAVVLVLAAALVLLARNRHQSPRLERRRAAVIAALTVAASLSVAVIVYTMFVGAWQVTFAGLTLRVHDLYRAVVITVICGVGLVLLSHRVRDALNRRSPLVFYAFCTVAMAVCALGPVVAVRGQILFEPAPYGLLMSLPGFDAVRIPSRFWMLGLMCLATAAGLAFAAVAPQNRARRLVLFAAVAGGVVLDGWITGPKMGMAPPQLPVVELTGLREPIVELPIGDGIVDAAATFRSIGHRRHVLNGVSGYDPPHYAPLVEGLMQHHPEMLQALASFGSFDVVVDESNDAVGAWTRFVSSVPGVTRIATDGARSAYRVPGAPLEEPRLGEPLPIARADANAGVPIRAIDGRLDDALEARWDDGPQHPKQWFIADLDVVREVAGVTEWLGEIARDFPRYLAIDVSIDGATWETVWEGRTAAMAFLASSHAPREAPLRFAFAPRQARFVRLRQLGESTRLWVIAELTIHGPS